MRPIFAFCLWLLCAFAPQASADEAKPLTVVTFDYPPYEYFVEGEVKGFAAKLVQAVFARMNQPVVVENYPWGRGLLMIRKGQADALFTAFKTPEREQFADYSQEVLFQQRVVLMVRKDADITFDGQLASLKDQRIGVARRISYGSRFDQAVRDKLFNFIDEADSGEANIEKLLAKRVDIIPYNEAGAKYITQKLGVSSAVKFLSPALEEIDTHIIFSKQRNLLSVRDQFDATLRAMKEDGSYARLMLDAQ